MRRAVDDGELEIAEGRLPERVVVESPPRRGGGDYAVSVAFQVARAGAGASPYQVARLLGERIAGQPGVGGVRVEGGGFLHVSLDARGRAALLRELSAARPGGASGTPETPENADHSGDPVDTDVTDRPAVDIARWAAATGEDPRGLAVRTACSSALFRVQYAHARTQALLRQGRALGLEPDPGPHPVEEPRGVRTGAGDAGAEGPARALLALLADHRRIAEQSAPDRHARHLDAVADSFTDFCEQCPPLPGGEEKPGAAHRVRLAFAEATGAVLAGGLSRLGVTAPAHL